MSINKEKETLCENEADKDKIAGRNAVIEALKAGREIDRILVAKGCTGLGKLYALAKEAGVPIISSMGAGNKLDPTAFEVADIYKTSVCPLAKVMRRELKKRGVKKTQGSLFKRTADQTD